MYRVKKVYRTRSPSRREMSPGRARSPSRREMSPGRARSPSRREMSPGRARSPSGREIRRVIVEEESSAGQSESVFPDDTTDGYETVIVEPRGRRFRRGGGKEPSTRKPSRWTRSYADDETAQEGVNKTKLFKRIMIGVLLIAAFVFAFYMGREAVQKKENDALTQAAENPSYCLPNKIQERDEVSLWLELDGINSESTDDVASIIEPAVQNGYNRATGQCSDACSRWAYLTKVQDYEDVHDEATGKATALLVHVKAYLSEYGCPTGSSFASVYPDQLDGTRRKLINVKGLTSSSRYSYGGQGLPGRHLKERSSIRASSDNTAPLNFLDTMERKLQATDVDNLDFNSVMASIEAELYSELSAEYLGAAFNGIQEVTIVQQDTEKVYTRMEPSFNNGSSGASKATKSSSGGSTSGTSKTSKSVGFVATKAKGSKTAAPTVSAAPTTLCGGSKSTKGGKGSKSSKSAAPTVSAVPTAVPSAVPSLGPSVSPSTAPSDTPSVRPPRFCANLNRIAVPSDPTIRTNLAFPQVTDVSGELCVDSTGALVGTITGTSLATANIRIYLLCGTSIGGFTGFTSGGTNNVGNRVTLTGPVSNPITPVPNFFDPAFTCTDPIFLLYNDQDTSGFQAFGFAF